MARAEQVSGSAEEGTLEVVVSVDVYLVWTRQDGRYMRKYRVADDHGRSAFLPRHFFQEAMRVANGILFSRVRRERAHAAHDQLSPRP